MPIFSVPHEGVRVLDVGCGVGGPARMLARRHGCLVTGLDVTKAFCDLGTFLTEKTGLSGAVEFRCGSALEMPFEKNSFDMAWMQHMMMNVSDKSTLLGEVARVLKPGGKLGFFDVFAGREPMTHYPVPWAREEGINFLSPDGEVRGLLEGLGFAVNVWQDFRKEIFLWLDRYMAEIKRSGPPPFSQGVVLGADFPAMAQNYVRNLAEDRLSVVMAVLSLEP